MIPPDVQRALDALEKRIRELEIDRTRLKSDVREEIRGMVSGIEAHVDITVRKALEPMLERLQKIDQIAADAAFNREAAEKANQYRVQREARERLLEEEKKRAELLKIQRETDLLPIEATRRYRIGLYTVLGGILAAVLALAGVALSSHL